jgi:hypothetical protein
MFRTQVHHWEHKQKSPDIIDIRGLITQDIKKVKKLFMKLLTLVNLSITFVGSYLYFKCPPVSTSFL